jgi:hypothetical protein
MRGLLNCIITNAMHYINCKTENMQGYIHLCAVERAQWNRRKIKEKRKSQLLAADDPKTNKQLGPIPHN